METETKKVGRPLAFDNAESLDAAIAAYFNSCEPHIAKTKIKVVKADGTFYWQEDEILIPAKPKVMSGLARALDVDRRTLLNYKNNEVFFPSIARALAICEEYAEQQLFEGRNSNGAAFALKNNFGDWKDSKELTGKDGAPIGMSPEAAAIIANAVKEIPDVEQPGGDERPGEDPAVVSGSEEPAGV